MSSGTTTATNVTFRPGSTGGQFVLSTQNHTHTLTTPMQAGQWGVVGVLFNGADSRFIGPNGLITPIALDAIPIRGIRLGGNAATLTTGTPGLFGDLSEVRAYTRAMPDADLLTTWQAMGGSAAP